MTLLLVPSCSLLSLKKKNEINEDILCTSDFEIVKLNPSEQPRDALENIAHINCTLHRVCGYQFNGDEFCPE